MDPERSEAAYEVEEYFLQNMLKNIDHRKSDGGGSRRSFGMESLDQAISYFKYALKRDSYCRRAYYRLGFLNLAAGHLDGLVEVSNELTKRFSNDPNGFFFLGLGYQGMGDLERAAGSTSDQRSGMSTSKPTTWGRTVRTDAISGRVQNRTPGSWPVADKAGKTSPKMAWLARGELERFSCSRVCRRDV